MASAPLPPAFTFYSHTRHITLGEEWEKEFGVDCRVFSNLFPCEITIDSCVYSSTETYFQGYKYSEGDKNFLRQLTSMSDVAAFGQRRLVLRKKHMDMIEHLKNEGQEYPRKPDGSDYCLKEKSSPVLLVDTWDTQKVGYYSPNTIMF